MIDGLIISAAEATDEGVRVRVGPILVALSTSARDQQELLHAAPCQVSCVLEVDDGRPTLIGFCSEESRTLYRCLRELSGIGPKTALSITGIAPARDVLRAAAAGEEPFFARAQGVGKARAARIAAHLRAGYGGRLPVALPVPVAAFVTAREGLVSAGADEDRAEQLLHAAAAADGARTTAQGLLESALRLWAER